MMLDRGKETITTTALDAEPERIVEMPEDSYAPLLLAIALSVLFVGLLLKVWAVVAIGALAVLAALLLWLWPRRRLLERAEPEPAHG